MLNTVDGPSEQVEDYLCDPEKMPVGARNSRLPCPEDCVLSDWGVWSPCALVRRASASSLCCCKNAYFFCFRVILKCILDFLTSLFPSQPCNVTSTRRRSAYPLRQPGPEKVCPPTEETEPCTLNSNCFHYSYNITGNKLT